MLDLNIAQTQALLDGCIVSHFNLPKGRNTRKIALRQTRLGLMSKHKTNQSDKRAVRDGRRYS